MSMNCSSSANATMSSNRLASSRRDIPRIAPLRKMFSRPVSSAWNPAPSSSRAATRPRVTISPLVGRRMPATHFSSVDLPDPLAPSRPAVAPSSTSRSMSRRAQNSSRGTRPKWIARSFRVWYRSCESQNRFETPRTEIAGGKPGSELLGEVALRAPEQAERTEEQHDRNRDDREEVPGVPPLRRVHRQDLRDRRDAVLDRRRLELRVDRALEGEHDPRDRVQLVHADLR